MRTLQKSNRIFSAGVKTSFESNSNFFLPIISGQPLLNPQKLRDKASNLPNMSLHEPPTNSYKSFRANNSSDPISKKQQVSPNFSINNQFIKSVISEAGPLNFYPLHCACSSESLL